MGPVVTCSQKRARKGACPRALCSTQPSGRRNKDESSVVWHLSPGRALSSAQDSQVCLTYVLADSQCLT